MSISNKNKDHLKDHAGVSIVEPPASPGDDDPFRFWTGHPTENGLVDLHVFAEGESNNPRPNGGGNWFGPFSGRPDLILELAPAIQARIALLAERSVATYLCTLRTWWRLFDQIEAQVGTNGLRLARVERVADLSPLHEAEAQKQKVNSTQFSLFLAIVNDARKLQKLGPLLWVPPKKGEPDRHLIPDDQAKEIKIALKQDWEEVRRTWAYYDFIRAEAERREAIASGTAGATLHAEPVTPLSADGENLLSNWQHYSKIQSTTGVLLPTSDQLWDGWSKVTMWNRGIKPSTMRAIAFPTLREADIAFHLALMSSGWNPSTLARLDASLPSLIFDHPKNVNQIVLASEDEEIEMRSSKPRAGGKMQHCIGLKKNRASPPVIVSTYLERTALLRVQLQRDLEKASLELAQLQAQNAEMAVINRALKSVQKLQRGCRSVWLYVNPHSARIQWIESAQTWKKYGDGGQVSYLQLVISRLNTHRSTCGKPLIGDVTPSDFRDIYARWVYVTSGGNILAVMIALGHSNIGSTANYLENNVFNAENDDKALRFMSHLLAELEHGRVDLTILAQLVRHGDLTTDMLARLEEYRRLMRSRVGVGCTDPRHPPMHLAPDHSEGKLCGTQRCLRDCPNAKFLPESLDGIAMRIEELVMMSYHIPRETWLRGNFQEELDEGEYLLAELYPAHAAMDAREKWREKISHGIHLIPGLGLVDEPEEA